MNKKKQFSFRSELNILSRMASISLGLNVLIQLVAVACITSSHKQINDDYLSIRLLEINFSESKTIFFYEISFKYIVCIMWAILSRPIVVRHNTCNQRIICSTTFIHLRILTNNFRQCQRGWQFLFVWTCYAGNPLVIMTKLFMTHILHFGVLAGINMAIKAEKIGHIAWWQLLQL